MKSKNVVIISHKNLPQPDDELVLYLYQKKFNNVVHITHTFSDSPTRISKCRWYRVGSLQGEWETGDYRKYPEPIIYIKEFIFTVYCVFKTKLKFNTAVCMDGMCTFFAVILRGLGKIKKVNYWAMDFVPERRFTSGIKNFIYHWINKLGYRNADEMWDLSPRMADAREEFLGINKDSYRSHRVVPYGMWLDRIKRYSYEECEKNTLVFMGHLIEKQGVQIVLDAIPEITKEIPDFKFKVIGTGSYEGKLKEKVKDLKIEKYVDFLGKIEKNEDLEEEIAKSCVAIAPYISKLDTWTKYADPGKVKTYLACGVPVLLTNVPWNAEEIDSLGCGSIIEENVESIVGNLLNLSEQNNNQKARNECFLYAKKFDYGNLFEGLDI